MKTTDLSKFDNSNYDPGSIIKRVIWYMLNVVFFINPLNPSSTTKVLILRLMGAQVGRNVVIKPSVNIKYPWLLEIGDYVWIGENVWIDNLSQITIKRNSCISQGAFLLTGNHNYKKTTFDLMAAPITLEEGVWIGARAVVCPGVTCRSHSVLTVCSVAVTELEPFSVYQGNPASKIHTRVIEQ